MLLFGNLFFFFHLDIEENKPTANFFEQASVHEVSA